MLLLRDENSTCEDCYAYITIIQVYMYIYLGDKSYNISIYTNTCRVL